MKQKFFVILGFIIISGCVGQIQTSESNNDLPEAELTTPPIEPIIEQDANNQVEPMPEKQKIMTSNDSTMEKPEPQIDQNESLITPPSKDESELTVEPITIPSSVENNCMGFLVGGPDEINNIALAGGAWVRPHPGPFAWQFIEPTKASFIFPDKWVEAAQQRNVTILATIWPYADWDQQECHSNSCEVSSSDILYPRTGFGGKETSGIPKSRCKPCSMDNYKRFLIALVERYDGDGTDDMPGLITPIKYWEILNEPEMTALDLTFFKGSKQDYVDILKASNEAIKSTCADCKTVQGGAAGSMETDSYWGALFDMGAGDFFDIANIHYIGSEDTGTLNSKSFKELLTRKGIDKPLWITEIQYREQNANVENSIKGAIKEGASKFFFVSFEVGRMGRPMPGQYSKIYEKIPCVCKTS